MAKNKKNNQLFVDYFDEWIETYKIDEIRDCGAIKLEFPNSEQLWFLYRELEEVPNE